MALLVGGSYASDYDLALDWGHMGDLTSFWSLSVEEHFYILWSLVLVSTPTILLPRVCLLILALAYSWKSWLILHNPTWHHLYFAFDSRMDPLIWGCLLASLLSCERTAHVISRICALRLFMPVVCGLLCLMIASLGHSALYTTPQDSMLLWMAKLPLIYVLFCALISSLYLQSKTLPHAVLGSAPMVFIGRLSYSIYLYQSLLPLVDAHIPQALISKYALPIELSKLSIIVTAAWFSYRFVEQPFLRLKGRFEPSSKAADSPTTIQAVPVLVNVSPQEVAH
jgi:peptidoglycan/LPS O-acetylase OafA/YrhL